MRRAIFILALSALCLHTACAFNVGTSLTRIAPSLGHGGRSPSAIVSAASALSSLAGRRAGVGGLRASLAQPSKADLPTGVCMEYFSILAEVSASPKAPIVFIHG